MIWSGVFPGQGSQQIGMGKFLFDNFPIARQTFEEASDVLKINLQKLCFEGPESDLILTENTQPALTTVSVASSRVIEETLGIPFKFYSGHSVGEYPACVAAKVFAYADALRAVRERGLAMQKAVPVGEGGMLAVMYLSDEQVIKLCHWVQEKSDLKPLEPANFNAPGQVVISGSQQAIEWLQKNYDGSIFGTPAPKARFIPLKVSAPFHSSLMMPAQGRMHEFLNSINFNNALIPVVQNFTGQAHTDQYEIRSNIIHQVSGSVKWTQCVTTLVNAGSTHFVELGCGKVLSGLIRKIAPEATVYNLNSLDDLKALEKIVKEPINE